jgi:hypothetical protein
VDAADAAARPARALPAPPPSPASAPPQQPQASSRPPSGGVSRSNSSRSARQPMPSILDYIGFGGSSQAGKHSDHGSRSTAAAPTAP